MTARPASAGPAMGAAGAAVSGRRCRWRPRARITCVPRVRPVWTGALGEVLVSLGEIQSRLGAAQAAVRQMHQLRARPPPRGRPRSRGDLPVLGREVAGWLRKLPAGLRDGTEKVLAEAAAAGASLDDLATITAHALKVWQAGHPDPDDEGDFNDRFVTVDTTFGGAGVIRGDLTPSAPPP
jgi:hypothetical protein